MDGRALGWWRGGGKYLGRFGPLGGGGGFLVFAWLRLGRLLRRGPERDCGRGEGGIRGLGATFGRGVSEQHAPPFP